MRERTLWELSINSLKLFPKILRANLSSLAIWRKARSVSDGPGANSNCPPKKSWANLSIKPSQM